MFDQVFYLTPLEVALLGAVASIFGLMLGLLIGHIIGSEQARREFRMWPYTTEYEPPPTRSTLIMFTAPKWLSLPEGKRGKQIRQSVINRCAKFGGN